MRLKDVALFEHAINERGLTVVDVGDNPHVANIGTRAHLHAIIGYGVELCHVSSTR